MIRVKGKYLLSKNKIEADEISIIGKLEKDKNMQNDYKVDLKYLNEFVKKFKIIEKDEKKKSKISYIFGLHKSWAEIGQEVLNRKSLFLAALYDLQNAGVKGEVQMLAATDVFVEKAQKILTKRAGLLLFLGAFVSTIALVILIVFGIYLKDMNVFKDLMDKNLPEKLRVLNGFSFSLIIFKKISLSAFFIGAAIFLAYIARALFHEGFTLYSKRHALRFGRLYVYLKGGKVDFKELEEAFQWNKDFNSAFKDIRPDIMSKTVLNIIPEIITPIAELTKSYYESKTNKKQAK